MPSPFYNPPSNFYIQPAGRGVGDKLAGIGSLLAQTRDKREAEKAAIAAEQAVMDAMRSGDPDLIAEASLAYPQYAEALDKSLSIGGTIRERQREDEKRYYQDVIANPEKAKEITTARLQMLQQMGRDGTETKGLLQEFMNPETTSDAMKTIERMYALRYSDEWKAYREATAPAEARDAPASYEALRLRALDAGLDPGTPGYQNFMLQGGVPGESDGEPAALHTLKGRALSGGLIPGTDEFKQFMLNNGVVQTEEETTAFRALEERAQAAGLTPGSEDYRAFMLQGGADGDTSQRTQRISELTARLTGSVEDPEAVATDIVDGNVRVEVLDSGQVRLVDQVAAASGRGDEAITELPIGSLSGEEGRPMPDRGDTLYSLAPQVAGVESFVKDAYGRIAGQLGLPVPEDVSEARQTVQTAQNDLIRALSINPRFPVGEIKRIQEEINIEPRIIDSPPSLRARMRSVDDSLRLRMEQEQRVANDHSMSQEMRSNARRSVVDIQNFLDVLGVPESIDVETFNSVEAVEQMNPVDVRTLMREMTEDDYNQLTPEVRQMMMEKARSG